MNKKRTMLFAVIMVALMVATVFVAVNNNSDDSVATDDVNKTYYVGIGEEYTTLFAAVKAAEGGSTIILKNDLDGVGIGLFNTERGGNKIEAKSLTIDFGGHKYNIDRDPIGSGTEYMTQGFHLESGCGNFVLKNGTITSTANSGVKMLVQNYCNLTLKDITLDGTNIGGGKYTLSNCFGDTTITGNTNIIAPTNGIAFDVWYIGDNSYKSGLSVKFDDRYTGTVTGKIEYGADANTKVGGWTDKALLTIENGIFKGDIVKSSKIYNDSEVPNIKIGGGIFTDINAIKYVVDKGSIILDGVISATDVAIQDEISVTLSKKSILTITSELNGKLTMAEGSVLILNKDAIFDGTLTCSEENTLVGYFKAGEYGVTITSGSVYINGIIVNPNIEGSIIVSGSNIVISGELNDGVNLEVRGIAGTPDKSNVVFDNFKALLPKSVNVDGAYVQLKGNVEVADLGYTFTATGTKVSYNGGYTNPQVTFTPVSGYALQSTMMKAEDLEKLKSSWPSELPLDVSSIENAKDAGNYTTVYKLTLTPTGSTETVIKYVVIGWEITALPVNVSVSSIKKVYDGNDNVTDKIILESKLINGDEVNLSAIYKSVNVGSGIGTIFKTGNSNYYVNQIKVGTDDYADDVFGDITEAKITVTPNSNQTGVVTIQNP